MFGNNIDQEALRKECEIYCASERVRRDAVILGMHEAAARAAEISATAQIRGLRPEHVKAYLDGKL